MKVRGGDITVAPGYDGEYGIVKIEIPEKPKPQKTSDSQIGIDF